MFHLTRKIDYGLVLLLELAESNPEMNKAVSPLSLRTLSKKRYLSFLFLQKVAMDLRKHGLIEAKRGKIGGYYLSKKPTEITLKEIFEALEGPISVMHCLGMTAKENLVHEVGCHSRKALNMLNEDMKQSMNRITLADFLNTPQQRWDPDLPVVKPLTPLLHVAAHN